MKHLKNHNGLYINLDRLKKFKPKEHLIPRDKYTHHIYKNKIWDHRKYVAYGILIGGILVGAFWIISLI